MYLREQAEDTLNARYDALIANLWSTDAAGNVTPPRAPAHRREILRLVTHVLYEKSIRSSSSSISLDETAIRDAASASYSVPKLISPFVGPPTCFAKFGKREHIRNAFDKGILRVAPARAFNDPSLNPAQRDDELMHWAVTPNEHLMVKLYGKDAEGNEVEIPVQKKEMFRGMAVVDFYVWCCGLNYDARLFHDFQAEAVIVIRNMDEFRSKFAATMARELPAWSHRDGPLAYYDPYNIKREQLFPVFTKNIKYLYQNEYRFAWIPPDGASTVDPIFADLGSLSDIAEFYEIDTAS